MKFKIIILITLTILSSLVITNIKTWDEYVYLMNAKYFAGQNIFFEDIRPPILPLILSIFYLINIPNLLFIVPYIIFALFLYSSYNFSKLFIKKKSINVLFFMILSPTLLLFFQKFLTSILATTFLLNSLIFLYKYFKKNKLFNICLSFLFASLTALTRYPLGLIYLILLILYFIFVKKNIKHFLISQLFFLIPILIWFFYIGWEAFYYAFLWGSGTSNFFYYLYNLIPIFGAILLFTPFLIKYKYKKNDLWIIIPIIFLFGFFQLFTNKENRFLIPIIPFISILLIKTINIKSKYLILIFIILFLITLFNINYEQCNPINYYNELSSFFNNKQEVNVLSNFCPIFSYYANVSCYPIAYLPEWLESWIQQVNASYLVVSKNYDFPTYSVNESYFVNYSMNKLINDNCEQILIYQTS